MSTRTPKLEVKLFSLLKHTSSQRHWCHPTISQGPSPRSMLWCHWKSAVKEANPVRCFILFIRITGQMWLTSPPLKALLTNMSRRPCCSVLICLNRLSTWESTPWSTCTGMQTPLNQPKATKLALNSRILHKLTNYLHAFWSRIEIEFSKEMDDTCLQLSLFSFTSSAVSSNDPP